MEASRSRASEQIKKVEEAVNSSYVTLDEEAALKEAEEVQKQIDGRRH